MGLDGWLGEISVDRVGKAMFGLLLRLSPRTS